MTNLNNTAGKTFSTTSWLLLLACLLLLEALIFLTTAKFANSAELVAQVGFGATVLSIVLAFVAIAYSFFQGEAQNIASMSLSSKLGEMSAISSAITAQTSNLERTATALSGDRDALKLTILKLDQVVSTVEATKEVAHETQARTKNLEAAIEEVSKAFTAKQQPQPDSAQSLSPQTQNEPTTTRAASAFIPKLTTGAYIATYALARIDGQKPLDYFTMQALGAADSENGSPDDVQFHTTFFTAHTRGVMSVYEAMGWGEHIAPRKEQHFKLNTVLRDVVLEDSKQRAEIDTKSAFTRWKSAIDAAIDKILLEPQTQDS
jgi:hypothetical protein